MSWFYSSNWTSPVFCLGSIFKRVRVSHSSRRSDKNRQPDRTTPIYKILLLLVIQTAAYWLLILAVNPPFWRHPKTETSLSRAGVRSATLFAAVCLEEIIWTDFYFDEQRLDGNIKTFNLLSEETVEGGSSILSSHFAPGGAFYLPTFATLGGPLLFWASNQGFFFFLFFLS